VKRIPKQEYTAASKEQAVAMVKGGKTVPGAARALGLIEQTLRNWVKATGPGQAARRGQGGHARADGAGPPDAEGASRGHPRSHRAAPGGLNLELWARVRVDGNGPGTGLV